MSDWQVGDLALCVKDDPCPYYGPSPYRKGKVYTVTAVVLSRRGHVGLSFAEIVINSVTGAAYHGDFVKIKPDEPKEADELDRCPLLIEFIERVRVS